MKLVTLNIRHGGGKRISAILAYLKSLDADVIILTEFRENSNAKQLRSGLAATGLQYFAAASVAPRENTVCVFSRKPFVSRTYSELSVDDRRRIISAHFETMAIYGVYFALNQAKASLFEFLARGRHRPTDAVHFIVGDFNTGLHFQDEEGATFYCVEQFNALSGSGLVDSWRCRNPGVKEYSWHSNRANGFRIDHVFSSLEADSMIERVYYDHRPRETGVTDHSALVVLNLTGARHEVSADLCHTTL
jgi:exonuclease III